MNNLNATGRLGQDATLKYTASGDPVSNFSLSLTAGYGEKQTTTWLNCILWGKRAETLAPMLLKGSQIGITGEISLRPYIAKDGTEKSSLERRIVDVTLLGNKADGATKETPATSGKPIPPEDFEDDVPF